MASTKRELFKKLKEAETEEEPVKKSPLEDLSSKVEQLKDEWLKEMMSAGHGYGRYGRGSLQEHVYGLLDGKLKGLVYKHAGLREGFGGCAEVEYRSDVYNLIQVEAAKVVKATIERVFGEMRAKFTVEDLPEKIVEGAIKNYERQYEEEFTRGVTDLAKVHARQDAAKLFTERLGVSVRVVGDSFEIDEKGERSGTPAAGFYVR